MEVLKNIKWYHVVIICLVLVVVGLIIYSFVHQYKNAHHERFHPASETTTLDQVREMVHPSPPNPHTVKDVNAEIMLYYATWCGHSRMFLPEWEKFENYAKGNMPYIRVSSVRCEDGNETVCFEKGIEGYPTVILYQKDCPEMQFRGERTAAKLIDFVEQNVKH
jgi:thiol-disulfide isomerase/thioredoxin